MLRTSLCPEICSSLAAYHQVSRIRYLSLQWRHNRRDDVSNHQPPDCLPFIQGAYQRELQSSASLAFVWGIHPWPVNSPHKGPITQKMSPFDDVSYSGSGLTSWGLLNIKMSSFAWGIALTKTTFSWPWFLKRADIDLGTFVESFFFFSDIFSLQGTSP